MKTISFVRTKNWERMFPFTTEMIGYNILEETMT